MWTTLILGALSTALSPVRLAIVALLASRTRPAPQLFAYWLGALVVGTSSLLIPLLTLHATPVLTRGWVRGPGVQYVRIGVGLLALAIAVLILVRSSRSRRRRPASGHRDDPAQLRVDDAAPPPWRWLLGRDDGAVSNPAPRRLLARVRNAWEGGSAWVAALIGALIGGPSADGVVLGLAIITTSGAPTSTQVCAAIALVLLMLAAVEVVLVGAVVAPAKAERAMASLHDWVRDHRTKTLVVAFTLLGTALIVQGVGSSLGR